MTTSGQGIRGWHGPKILRRRRIPEEQWEKYKDELIRLYQTSTLKDLREYMRVRYGFGPSSHQYVSKFEKWGVRKYHLNTPKQLVHVVHGSESVLPDAVLASPGAETDAIRDSAKHDPDLTESDQVFSNFEGQIVKSDEQWDDNSKALIYPAAGPSLPDLAPSLLDHMEERTASVRDDPTAPTLKFPPLEELFDFALDIYYYQYLELPMEASPEMLRMAAGHMACIGEAETAFFLFVLLSEQKQDKSQPDYFTRFQNIIEAGMNARTASQFELIERLLQPYHEVIETLDQFAQFLMEIMLARLHRARGDLAMYHQHIGRASTVGTPKSIIRSLYLEDFHLHAPVRHLCSLVFPQKAHLIPTLKTKNLMSRKWFNHCLDDSTQPSFSSFINYALEWCLQTLQWTRDSDPGIRFDDRWLGGKSETQTIAILFALLWDGLSSCCTHSEEHPWTNQFHETWSQTVSPSEFFLTLATLLCSEGSEPFDHATFEVTILSLLSAEKDVLERFYHRTSLYLLKHRENNTWLWDFRGGLRLYHQRIPRLHLGAFPRAKPVISSPRFSCKSMLTLLSSLSSLDLKSMRSIQKRFNAATHDSPDLGPDHAKGREDSGSNITSLS